MNVHQTIRYSSATSIAFRDLLAALAYEALEGTIAFYTFELDPSDPDGAGGSQKMLSASSFADVSVYYATAALSQFIAYGTDPVEYLERDPLSFGGSERLRVAQRLRVALNRPLSSSGSSAVLE